MSLEETLSVEVAGRYAGFQGLSEAQHDLHRLGESFEKLKRQHLSLGSAFRAGTTAGMGIGAGSIGFATVMLKAAQENAQAEATLQATHAVSKRRMADFVRFTDQNATKLLQQQSAMYQGIGAAMTGAFGPDATKRLTVGAAKMTAIFGGEMVTNTSTLVGILRAFHTQSSQVPARLDAITVAARRSGRGLDFLTGSAGRMLLQAQAAGASFGEALALAADVSRMGVGSRGVTTFSSVVQRLGALQTQPGFGRLVNVGQYGIAGSLRNLFNAPNATPELLKKLLGGGIGYTLAQRIAQQGAPGLGPTAGALGGQFNQYSRSEAGRLKQFQLSLDDLQETMGKALLPALVQILKALTPVIQQFGAWAQKNPQTIRQMTELGVKIGAVSFALRALGPFAKLAGGLLSALKFGKVADDAARAATGVGAVATSAGGLKGVLQTLTGTSTMATGGKVVRVGTGVLGLAGAFAALAAGIELTAAAMSSRKKQGTGQLDWTDVALSFAFPLGEYARSFGWNIPGFRPGDPLGVQQKAAGTGGGAAGRMPLLSPPGGFSWQTMRPRSGMFGAGAARFDAGPLNYYGPGSSNNFVGLPNATAHWDFHFKNPTAAVHLPGGGEAQYRISNVLFSPLWGGEIDLTTPQGGTIQAIHLGKMNFTRADIGKWITGNTLLGNIGFTGPDAKTPHLHVAMDAGAESYMYSVTRGVGWRGTRSAGTSGQYVINSQGPDLMAGRRAGGYVSVGGHRASAGGPMTAGVSGTVNWNAVPKAVSRWSSQIEKVARQVNISPLLLAAVIQRESNGDPQATRTEPSGHTSYGLMQIMDFNFEALGLTWSTRFDPYRNILAGAKLLKGDLTSARGDPRGMLHGLLHAYNGPAMTEGYFKDITGNISAWQGAGGTGAGTSTTGGRNLPTGTGAPTTPAGWASFYGGRVSNIQATINQAFPSPHPGRMSAQNRDVYRHLLSRLAYQSYQEERSQIMATTGPGTRRNALLAQAQSQQQWRQNHLFQWAQGGANQAHGPAYWASYWGGRAGGVSANIAAIFGDQPRPSTMQPENRALYREMLSAEAFDIFRQQRAQIMATVPAGAQRSQMLQRLSHGFQWREHHLFQWAAGRSPTGNPVIDAAHVVGHQWCTAERENRASHKKTAHNTGQTVDELKHIGHNIKRAADALTGTGGQRRQNPHERFRLGRDGGVPQLVRI